ncbi:hypothetical protein BerOc1_01724 [Pseudodesulfovibrio hydrargyri]|uniref:Uncharacterized protein n=1 Tax=Pseudodesulfovibrio hydrargyri TaxID=2125990 RepID=A0A1J5N945_9BACT|nr:hypothetical protein [Pseudodesulfovibrio hydrargyri]OIQ49799.1 hypothetical protein BerOc1_01724 [Pseudodesulfovibrio hydrargyri]
MCAAVPVALLLLVILVALTILRLSKPAPNAQLISLLLEPLAHDLEQSGLQDSTPSASTSSRTGNAGTA